MTQITGLRDILAVPVSAESLQLAVTHRSYAYENGRIPHNERLEFLGDAVLGLIVTEALFRLHPDLPEGQLARMRSSIVNSNALAEVARTIGLGDYLLLGRGEQLSGGREKASILADAMEAVLGAVHEDCGLTTAGELIDRLFKPLIAQAATLGAALDWKTSLQEAAAARGLGVPEYRVTASGPDHSKSFTAHVHLGGGLYGEGEGPSKKIAEQRAAESAHRRVCAG